MSDRILMRGEAREGEEHEPLAGSLPLCIASNPLPANTRRRHLQANLLMGARSPAGVIYKNVSPLQYISTVIQLQHLLENQHPLVVKCTN